MFEIDLITILLSGFVVLLPSVLTMACESLAALGGQNLKTA